MQSIKVESVYYRRIKDDLKIKYVVKIGLLPRFSNKLLDLLYAGNKHFLVYYTVCPPKHPH